MYKQIIILRKDLEMGKGKIITQCIHAAIGAMRKIEGKVVGKWGKEGGKKIVLKVNDLQELKKVEEKLKKAKISYFLVKDAGLTQLKRGTITVMGIGPVEETKIDKITGKLKLL